MTASIIMLELTDLVGSPLLVSVAHITHILTNGHGETCLMFPGPVRVCVQQRVETIAHMLVEAGILRREEA